MDKIIIRALGQTIEHKGEVALIIKEMPVNCMVLFVDMDTWHKKKDLMVLEKGGVRECIAQIHLEP